MPVISVSSKHAVLLAALALSACAVGTDYTAPKPVAPAAWTGGEAFGPPAPGGTTILATKEKQAPWWERLKDAPLAALITRADTENLDLAQAEGRLAEARANERVAFGALLPQINGSAGLTRERLGPPYGRTLDTTRQLGVDGSWEIDPFGGNRRRAESAEAEIEAAQADRDFTRLNLRAELARAYIRLRGAQAQRLITEENLDHQRATLDMTKAERREQMVSDLDVARASAEVETTAAQIPRLHAAAITALNRAAVLSGQAPEVLKEMLAAPGRIPTLPSELVLTSPIETITRRPDVRAAERRLASASALSNAAFAQLFPKLSLQGFFGTRDSNLYGAGPAWSGTLSSLVPLLNFGTIRGQMAAADARQQQAFAGYKQTVLLALEEVENALAAYLAEERRHQRLLAAASDQAHAADVARAQYREGQVPQLDLLVAQRNALEAENEAVLSEQLMAENLVLLWRALGEGLENTDTSPPPIPEKSTQEKNAEPAAH